MDQQFENDAKTLRTAMKGLGTDEAAIIKLIGNRTNAQRLQIKSYYTSCFGRDLIADLKDELGGHFEDVAVNMFKDPVEFDVDQLHQAMKGSGTREHVLIEIIGSRPATRLQQIKNLYKQKYGLTLDDHVKDETSGDLQRLLISLLQCNRSESPVASQQQAEQDAKDLFEAGEKKFGTDESVFNRIFTLRSPAEILAMAVVYEHAYGKSIMSVIDDEFSGDTRDLLKTIAQALIYPSQYFASVIRRATKGWGTEDTTLIRVIISRDEVDLPQIKQAFLQMYGLTLEEEIKDETSGDYKKMLLEIVSH